jgi:peptide-methionine (S)-S-oxide reductase
MINSNDLDNKLQIATLGGGCFWCLEAVYQDLRGVHQVISGYAGGHVEFPDYESVCDEVTGHAEVVQIHFNPDEVTYRQILEVFFVIHDPTTQNRQGNDVGTQYRSVIYCEDEDQINCALDVINELTIQKTFADSIVTEIMMAPTFYPAEAYHQNYFRQHPGQGYCAYVVAPKLQKFQKTFKAFSLSSSS